MGHIMNYPQFIKFYQKNIDQFYAYYKWIFLHLSLDIWIVQKRCLDWNTLVMKLLLVFLGSHIQLFGQSRKYKKLYKIHIIVFPNWRYRDFIIIYFNRFKVSYLILCNTSVISQDVIPIVEHFWIKPI